MNITARRLFFTDFGRRLGERRAERVERGFFDSLQLRNGTTKQTAAGRLKDVDHATTAYFRGLAQPPRNFLDVAVSSGISTGEWYRALSGAGLPGVTMTGTDLTLHAYLVEVNRYFRVLVQSDNFPLQFDVAGIAISTARRGRRGYLDGSYLAVWCLQRVLRRICTGLEPGTPSKDGDRLFAAHGLRIRRVQLISPRVGRLNQLAFVDDDLSATNDPTLVGKFEVIRAANILNHIYFPHETLTIILKRLAERLQGPGSFLLVSRTRPAGGNDATLFLLNAASRFEVVLRVGAGSEVEPLVLSTRVVRP